MIAAGLSFALFAVAVVAEDLFSCDLPVVENALTCSGVTIAFSCMAPGRCRSDPPVVTCKPTCKDGYTLVGKDLVDGEITCSPDIERELIEKEKGPSTLTGSFQCDARVCPWTCSAAEPGAAPETACKTLSEELSVGSKATSPCQEGYGLSDIKALFDCTSDLAEAGTTTNMVCSFIGDPQNFVDSESFYSWAEGNSPGFADIADRCNSECRLGEADGAIVNPAACKNPSANAPRCSSCLQCAQSLREGRQTIVGDGGQLLFTCPPTATSAAAVNECFVIAVCGGLVTTADTCVNGVAGTTGKCPPCPRSESKKGLLGLLGLLGIIPVVLISCSIIALLLLCRRKKSGDEVIVATFDARAPVMTPCFVGGQGLTPISSQFAV